MPRRVYTYLAGLGWDGMNLVSTLGAFVMAAGILLFLVNAVVSLLFGARAGDDPWGGNTLEWATSSPPPPYNFLTIPVVRSRDPLWDETAAEHEGWVTSNPQHPRRDVMVTTLLDAAPDHIDLLPGPTIWPLWAAVGAAIAFLGSMIHLLLVPLGALIAVVAFVAWLWPPREELPA
jgi:cytochrome c oxidase subunit 1